MRTARDFSHIPIVDVRELVAGGPGQGEVALRLGQACRESGFFYVVGHGVDEATADAAARPQPGVLRPGRGDQDADPHGPGRPGLAGLLPRRRRADLRQAGPEGGPVLRRGAAADDHRWSWPARRLHGPNLFPPRAGGLPRDGAGVHGRADAAGPSPDGRAGAEPGPGGVLLRRPLHRRAADPVPHLQLPAAGRPGALGSGRAHRLRPADDPAAGRRRRPGGEVAVADGSPPRRCRARSSATSATCSTA